MSNPSRLNPDKSSRATLRELQDNDILHRRRVGLRHIIRADGSVEHSGYNSEAGWARANLPNFHPTAYQLCGEVVEYESQRAELSATLGRLDCAGHILDVSTHFPLNQLATDLYAAVIAKGGWCPPSGAKIFGDAVLVTDNRMHWVFRRHGASHDEVEDFRYMLNTPNDLLVEYGRACIFFHQEPSHHDLVTLKLRWL